jgi:ssDNA-binding replication factor A large subunit
MNKATFKGTILEIGEPKTFTKEKKDYTYRTVVIDTGKGIIASNYWFDKPLPEVGTNVTFIIKVNSERNPNNPEPFFHKLNLHNIYESSRIPQEVQH